MGTVIATFETTRAAIVAERTCVAAGIKCQAIPVPRTISAGCGIALEIDELDCAKAETVFRGVGISCAMMKQAR
jgi:hypothetical protein